VKVTLRNCDTQALRTTHTDATGNYHFGNVVAGSYSICIDIPDGYKATLEDQGADDGMDSDINSEGCTGCQAYTCEASDVTRDAGICVNETGGECDNTIGSRVWYDTNCNGIQDQDETTGPEGVKVTLTNCSTQVERTTTTDASGNYHFGNVATGDHKLDVLVDGKLEGGADFNRTGQFTFRKEVKPKLVGLTLAGPRSGNTPIALGDW